MTSKNNDIRTLINDCVEEGLTRKEICQKLQLDYSVVQRILKNRTDVASGKTVVEVDGMSRSEYIRQQLAEGANVSSIAKELDIPYQYVYRLAKETNCLNLAGRTLITVDLEIDGAVKTVSRKDAIEYLYKSGLTISEIAKKVNCSYQIVYQAVQKYSR